MSHRSQTETWHEWESVCSLKDRTCHRLKVPRKQKTESSDLSPLTQVGDSTSPLFPSSLPRASYRREATFTENHRFLLSFSSFWHLLNMSVSVFETENYKDYWAQWVFNTVPLSSLIHVSGGKSMRNPPKSPQNPSWPKTPVIPLFPSHTHSRVYLTNTLTIWNQVTDCSSEPHQDLDFISNL